jgi:hypothetical protein
MSLPAWLVLAASPSPAPFDKSRVEPGWIGFAFFVVMAGAVALLWFSLRKHLGRIDVSRHQRDRAAGPPQTDRPEAPAAPERPASGPPTPPN